MMKKYKLYIAMAASLFMMSSCYDLDVYPEDKIPAQEFFKTKKHADQAMMGVYSQMQHEDVFGRQPGLDCLGFVGAGYDPASYRTIGNGNYTTTEGLVTGKFKALYEGITRANLVLQNLDGCMMDPKNAENNEKLKIQYKGEARFMRALYYFTLLDFFGGVPLYDEKTIVADEYMNMLKPRSTADATRTFILEDLRFAEENLPTAWDQVNRGRATKAAAQALMGKVLLYKANATKQKADYIAAKDAFVKLLKPENVDRYGQMELYSDYEDLFKPGGDESSEMIFAIQNIGGASKDYGMPLAKYLGSRATFGSDWNNVMASVLFVDSYEYREKTNGSFQFDWNHWCQNYNENKAEREKFLCAKVDDKGVKVADAPGRDKLLEMYDKRDPRMQASIILPQTFYLGWYQNLPKNMEMLLLKSQGKAHERNGLIRINGGYQFYLWRKFVPEANMGGELNNREDTPINFPLIRLADVYLMLAECFNEVDEPQNALECINAVRARVEMPEINAENYPEVGTDKKKIFERIRLERQWELAAEGWSFADMKRWEILGDITKDALIAKGGEHRYDVKSIFDKTIFTRVVRERDYLWPIPENEINKNPNLEGHQNPGW